MSEPFLGQITMYGVNFAIRSWAQCDGQLMPISQNPALFSLLGTNYGGDGRTTYGLPDMRGRVPVHYGRGTGLTQRSLGQRGGEENHTLNIAEMPDHNHTVAVTTKVIGGDGTATSPANAYPAGGPTAYGTDAGRSGFATFAADQTSVTLQDAGGSQPHNNMQPFMVVNFQIALQGIFPSRS